jgi:terminase large subunit-like protein
MSGPSLTVLARRLDALAAQLQPPALPPDPVAFARLAGLDLDPWQAAFVAADRPQQIVLASRQVGKSTTTALLAVRLTLTTPHGLALLIAPSWRQSAELLAKCRTIAAAVASAGVSLVDASAVRLTFANGSRIVSLPGGAGLGHTIRGYSAPELIVVDEAARCSDQVYLEVLRPMRAARPEGRLILLSSPAGQRGFFFREWTNGVDWARWQVPATASPRIDPAWLERERQAMPAAAFRQEYLCEFTAADDSVFDPEAVDRALVPQLPTLFGDEQRSA